MVLGGFPTLFSKHPFAKNLGLHYSEISYVMVMKTNKYKIQGKEFFFCKSDVGILLGSAKSGMCDVIKGGK